MPDIAIRPSTRLIQTQELLAHDNIDLLLVTPSSDLLYLTGYGSHPSERPTVLAVPREGDPVMVVPRFEAPRVPENVGVALVTYEETGDPVRELLLALGTAPVRRAAVSDEAWASVLLRFQAALPMTEFAGASRLLGRLRMRKTEAELDLMRRAGAMVDVAFEQLTRLRFAGRTERNIAEELNAILRQSDLVLADWGPNVASGANGASPHHITGDRVIHEGDAVVLDFGGAVEGYQADITRTVHVGTPSAEFVRVYGVVKRAQDRAVEAVRPGVAAETIDAAARSVIIEAGYGAYFSHRTGHGIGLDAHEEPYIVEGNTLTLEPGMTFSVEPGVYLPGKFGVRIEDIISVTPEGWSRLNASSRDLVIVH